MIRLENVSKYYHNEGVVSLGLRKVSLEFQIGEFVAITGESGSGKSTLLNVISGIDTYEEGEIYINGEETSHYEEEDWEHYRKNRVAFIFQNYNLIYSYTVLKNVEVALLSQGHDLKTRRAKAKEILERVGLGRHLRHRASKLSGGEKQRLAIARALANNSDIIVADEPTGNLDSASAKQVFALLNEVAKDKLVLVVTHNYELAKDYATRVVRLFEGEVVEDREIKPFIPKEPREQIPLKMSEWKKSAAVALYNVFGQPRKSILLFLVSLTTVFFVFLLYGLLLSIGGGFGGGYYFESYNVYPERVLVIRKDKAPLTDEDYEKLKKIPNVKRVVKEDAVLDISFYLFDSRLNFLLHFAGYPGFLDDYDEKNLIGRFPEADGEILLCTYVYEDDLGRLEDYLDKEYQFSLQKNSTDGRYISDDREYKLVGIYAWSEERSMAVLNEGEIRDLYNYFRPGYQTFVVTIEREWDTTEYHMISDFFPDSDLEGYQISSEIFQYYSEGTTFKWQDLVLEPVPWDGGKQSHQAYVSWELYDKIIPFEHRQYTLELSREGDAKEVLDRLYREGYYSFCPHQHLRNYNISAGEIILKMIITLGIGFSLMVIYLLSYLIFRAIFNSKVQDYTILRIIGFKNANIKQIILFEILTFFFFSYLAFLLIYHFNKKSFEMMAAYGLRDFLFVGLINLLLALLITRRFILYHRSRSLFAALRIGG